MSKLGIVHASIWISASMLMAAHLAADTHNLLESKKGSTPWYSSSWLEQPVTNLYLSFFDAREYSTPNAIKSEIWRVREVRAGDAVFWTTLKRKPI